MISSTLLTFARYKTNRYPYKTISNRVVFRHNASFGH